MDALLAESADQARVRAAADQDAAAVLGARATIFPEGYAVLTPGPIAPAALSRLMQAISGRPFAPPPAAVAALAQFLRPATLGGVRVMDAGRLGPGWLVLREEAAMAPAVPLRGGQVWDGRFRVGGEPPVQPGDTLGPLGADAAKFRGCGVPSAVLRTIPAVRRSEILSALPLPAYTAPLSNGSDVILRHNAGPACGAPFLA